MDIIPFKTLVISEDGTYPGIVIKVEERVVIVNWYKWINQPPFKGVLHPTQIGHNLRAQYRIITPFECKMKFAGFLPPEYQEPHEQEE